MTGKFLDPLELEYLDGRTWRLTAPFDYHLGTPEGLETVTIPSGFVTDFASVPEVLWNVLPPTGSYGKAAVVHDWLYQHRTVKREALSIPFGNGKARHLLSPSRLVTRSEADHILLEAMVVLGVTRLTRWAIYLGVRVGGWKPWNAYRAKGM